eukprot:403365273
MNQSSANQCNIKVAVRVRPLIRAELIAGQKSSRLQVNDQDSCIQLYPPILNGNYQNINGKTSMKSYYFDKIFGQDSTQSEVFNQLQVNYLIKRVIEVLQIQVIYTKLIQIVQGYNSTIFLYGQTGSGKTYTMEGYDYELYEQKTSNGRHYTMNPNINHQQNLGLAVRTIKEFFRQRTKIKDHLRDNFTFSVSFFQIYNEKVYDLLNFNNNAQAPGGRQYLQNQNDLKVRWNNKDQFIVENLYTYECYNSKEAIALYNQGIKNKIVSSHKMNHASSRSHCIFSINVDQYSPNNPDQPMVSSKMFLVDLAGSERISFIGDIDKDTQRETIQINKSLMTLRKCIAALSSSHNQDDKHIPYRECKLTSILKQSLGGNCYCLMIACVSPSDYNYEENIQTLNYAMKTNNIKNIPIKNKDPDQAALDKLKNYNRQLENEIKQTKRLIDTALQDQETSTSTKQPTSDFSDIVSYSRNDDSDSVQNRKSPRSKMKNNFSSLPQDDLYRHPRQQMRTITKQQLMPQSFNGKYIPKSEGRYTKKGLMSELEKAIDQGENLSPQTVGILQKLIKNQGNNKNVSFTIKKSPRFPQQDRDNSLDSQLKNLSNNHLVSVEDQINRLQDENSLLKEKLRTSFRDFDRIKDLKHYQSELNNIILEQDEYQMHSTQRNKSNPMREIQHQILEKQRLPNLNNSFIDNNNQANLQSTLRKLQQNNSLESINNSRRNILLQQQQNKSLQEDRMDYPLFHHPQVTENFPPQFYQDNNQNFKDYKDLEQKIFDNRSKIVDLKKVLIPFQGSPPQRSNLVSIQNNNNNSLLLNNNSSSLLGFNTPEIMPSIKLDLSRNHNQIGLTMNNNNYSNSALGNKKFSIGNYSSNVNNL